MVAVVEGKRINLRIYRRLFYPIPIEINSEQHIIYSDTGREKEINYKNADFYGLENPFNRIRLYRLARAMNCLECKDLDNGVMECEIIICTNKELYDPKTKNVQWIPFDPDRAESLADRLRKLRRKIEWKKRKKTS